MKPQKDVLQGGPQKASIAAASQQKLMEAGYEPRAHWVYIGDLVEGFRQRQAARQDLLQEVDALLAGSAPITRAGFRIWCSELLQRESTERSATAIQAQVARICVESGILDPGPGHEALARRVVELEGAVKGHAEGARAAGAVPAARHRPTLPFLAGVRVDGAWF